MSDLISRQAVIEAIVNRETTTTRGKEYLDGYAKCQHDILDIIEQLPSVQPEHTSNNDCNGCKFVGCYDTDFPCANCIRKNKDYYDSERITDE